MATVPPVTPEGPPNAQTVLPRWLFTGGAWSWRLIVMGVVAAYLLRFVLRIEIVVLPAMAALVFTALLRPVSMFLQHRGLPRFANREGGVPAFAPGL